MKERMKMLVAAKVITQRAHDATLDVTACLVEEWGVDETSEQIQMAMTHFARAIDRIDSDQAVTEGLDPEIMDEIASDPIYGEVVAMNEKLCEVAGIKDTPVTESSFFISNLYAMRVDI